MFDNNNIIVVYSVDDVMDILQLSRNTILKYIKSKKIKASFIGNSYRIRKEDLDAFIDSLQRK